MKTCIKCGKPMRFLGLVMIAGIGPIVGAECPDESCKSHKAFEADDWKRSLQWAPDTNIAEKMACQMTEGF